jgi:hypothetical protein
MARLDQIKFNSEKEFEISSRSIQEENGSKWTLTEMKVFLD